MRFASPAAVLVGLALLVPTAALAATFTGGSGSDNFTGTSSADKMNGNGGNDFLEGRGGADRINGGSGGDSLAAGTAAKDAASGMLYSVYSSSVDTITCGSGYDLVVFDTNDVLTDASACEIEGLSGNDSANTLTSSSTGSDMLFGRGGNDTLKLGATSEYDLASGGTGKDTITATSGSGTSDLIGGPGADTLKVTSIDSVLTEGNADSTTSDGSVDTITCGSGYDIVYYGSEDRITNPGACERRYLLRSTPQQTAG